MSLGHLTRWLPAALLVLPLLGYVWPLPEAPLPAAGERDWHWPEARTPIDAEPAPQLLARFWPVRQDPAAKTTTDAAAEALAARRALRLVAVIRQGNSLQALVQRPDGRIESLMPGDALDERRRVTAIEATLLRWQDGDEQGELALFPRRDITDNTNE